MVLTLMLVLKWRDVFVENIRGASPIPGLKTKGNHDIELKVLLKSMDIYTGVIRMTSLMAGLITGKS